MSTEQKTFYVEFVSGLSIKTVGRKFTFHEALRFIGTYLGTDYELFREFRNGFVYIRCNETGEIHYRQQIHRNKRVVNS